MTLSNSNRYFYLPIAFAALNSSSKCSSAPLACLVSLKSGMPDAILVRTPAKHLENPEQLARQAFGFSKYGKCYSQPKTTNTNRWLRVVPED